MRLRCGRIELRREVSPIEAQTALEQLLDLRVRRVSTAPLVREAWGMRHNVTVADALYVIIGRRLQVPLVTGDARLARAPGLGVEILSTSSPPPLQRGSPRRQRLRARS